MEAVFTTFFLIGASLSIALVLFLVLPSLILYRLVAKKGR